MILIRLFFTSCCSFSLFPRVRVYFIEIIFFIWFNGLNFRTIKGEIILVDYSLLKQELYDLSDFLIALGDKKRQAIIIRLLEEKD